MRVGLRGLRVNQRDLKARPHRSEGRLKRSDGKPEGRDCVYHAYIMGARDGAVDNALASLDRRLRGRARTLSSVGHPAIVTSPKVSGPNGKTAVNPPKRIC